jgi:hypothetical protein
MPVPALDPSDRSRALAKATDARRRRAETKRRLKQGETTLAAVLDAAKDDAALSAMRVAEVIEAMPAFGPAKTARLMEQIGIASSRRIRGLGPRQRSALLAAFGR